MQIIDVDALAFLLAAPPAYHIRAPPRTPVINVPKSKEGVLGGRRSVIILPQPVRQLSDVVLRVLGVAYSGRDVFVVR